MNPGIKYNFPTDEVVHSDCRYFLGDRPCKPHKKSGVHCKDCGEYNPIHSRILIIKLGAAGDVIRTTPLLHVLGGDGIHVTWLTEFPEVLPQDRIDRILKLDASSLAYLQATSFDALYNLDKDPQAIALCKIVEATEKYGFTMERGVCVPLEERARPKWLTGLFDDFNRKNLLSYLEEIFIICGQKFQGEKYIVPLDDSDPFALDLPRPLIGLNTGCGSRWPSRLWAFERWEELAKLLQRAGFSVLILGGPEEQEKNQRLAQTTSAKYLGYFPLPRFFHLINEVDVLVTGVTMALHVGIGLGKRIVLQNNIFNKHEFELYGLGRIIEPNVNCLGCFKPVCDDNCIDLITPAQMFRAVKDEVAKLNVQVSV